MSTTENENREIDLTPNYETIFRVMLRDAKTLAQAKYLFADFEEQAAALRRVQRFLAPLNIAAQCMTDRKAVEQFREALNEMVQDIARITEQREKHPSLWASDGEEE